jgi:hypothetical protein
VPPNFQLLATLRSRIGQEILIESPLDNAAWHDFLNGSYDERLKQIELWHKTKNQIWLSEIANGLHGLLSRNYRLEVLNVIQFVGQKIQTRGASNKMLLEHLALVLPLRK